MRLRFTRGAAFLGQTQHDYVGAIMDAMVRAELPVALNTRTPPRPRLTTGLSLPMNYTSRCEYIDIDLLPPHSAPPLSALAFAQCLTEALPEDVELLWARRIPPRTPHLRGSVCDVCYTIRDLLDPDRACAFHASSTWPFERERKGKKRIVDLKQSVLGLDVQPDMLQIKLAIRPEGVPKPEEVLRAVFGLSREHVEMIPIERTAMRLATAPYPRILTMEL